MNRRTTNRPQSTPKSSAPVSINRRTGARKPHKQVNQVIPANVLFIILVLIIAGIYGLIIYAFYEVEVTPGANKQGQKDIPSRLEDERRMALRGVKSVKKGSKLDVNQYSYWRNLAVRLAAMPAKDVLKELNETDPFGTRNFEQVLLEQETKFGRLLEHFEIEAIFPCPTSRITLPDQRNLQKSKDFRDDKPGTFLFFQHLRKGMLYAHPFGSFICEVPYLVHLYDSRWHALLLTRQGKLTTQ